MPNHPLAEVFGFPADNMSVEAEHHRRNRLCPFGNRVPNCTKDKVGDPLGVCSIFDGEEVVVTCPVRFRQGGLMVEDAAQFFGFPDATWSTVTEVRLTDKEGASAGNIDFVVVRYDADDQVTDYGALEVQAVYVSGNVRRPFAHYMVDPANRHSMDWRREANYPRPDYLSSSRKRLAPQLIYKGGILHAWGRKMAVAVNRGFFAALPALTRVEREQADVAWLIYDLTYDAERKLRTLDRCERVYTNFQESLTRITTAQVGDEQDFIACLQSKLNEMRADGDQASQEDEQSGDTPFQPS